MPTPVKADRPRILALAAAAFPLLLLLFATFFLRGQIGFWSDDYWHNQRDPVTQAMPDLWASGHFSIKPLIIDRGFFLRPVFYFIVPLVTTLSWTQPWAGHLVLAAIHGVACLLLWRLMLRLRLSPRASAAAALLYMVYPMQFEAVLWLAAIPTGLAVVLMLWVYHMHIAVARGRTAWWRLPMMTLAAFGVCCCNEQPAAGVFAMPLLYLAALPRPLPGPREATPDRRRAGRHAVRALLPPFCCGCAVLFYLFLVKRGIPALGINPVPKGIRGAADTLIAPEQLPARLRDFGRSLWPRIWMKNFAGGTLQVGLAELRAAGAWSLLWAAALGATGVLWAARWVRAPKEDAGQPARPLGAAAFGLTVYILGFLPPTLVAVYLADSRLMYWPSVGLAVAIAAAGTALGRCARKEPRRPVGRVLGVATLAAVLLAGGVCYIGIQAAFRDRWRMDQDEGRQLAALVPAPPPYSFFLPMRIDSRAMHTGYPVFDVHHRSVWEFMWTAPKFIKTALHNDMVRCGYWRSWTPNDPMRGADESGIHYADRLGPAVIEENGQTRRAFPPIEGSGSRVPWSQAVPFVVDREGRVHLVTTIIIEAKDQPPVSIPVPQAKGLPPFEWKLPRA